VTVLVLDSHGSHAAVVKLMMSVSSFDVVYYSDTRFAPFDELSGLTRVSRLLNLLGLHVAAKPSAAILLGRGMSWAPRQAVDLGGRRAGIEIIYAADLTAEYACGMLLPRRALCVIGDSCVTREDVQGRLGQRDFHELRWARIAPAYQLDMPLKPLLKDAGWSIGGYVLATPQNRRVAADIASLEADVPVIDEYEHLALALAARLPEAPAPRLSVSVSERSPAVVARIKHALGTAGDRVVEFGPMEGTPVSGPFAVSLDAEGNPD
jgi:hypothetical protein